MSVGALVGTAWIASFDVWVLVPFGFLGYFLCLLVLYVVLGEDSTLDASLKPHFRRWILLAGPVGVFWLLLWVHVVGRRSDT